MSSFENLSELSDEQVVSAVRENDHELYSELIRRYQTKLSHYLRKFIHDSDELEDVLQDIFIKAYRNLYDFDIDKRFSPWIYRIAHNEAINNIKKYSKEVISLDESEWDILDEKIDMKRTVDAGFAKERIGRAFSMIKNKYREPLVLYFFEERTYEEISDILKIPRSTAGILIMRGKKILKEYLEKDSYGKST
jgi:RNA polymerase sigma-70 factor (ECF subfamily)